MLVMGLVVGQTGISYTERPWSVRFINASLYIHAALSVVTAVAAFRVWERRWWVARAGILVAGWITCAIAVGTLFSTVGYSL